MIMQRQGKIFLIIIAFLMAIIFLHVTRVLVPFEEMGRVALAPLGSLATKTGVFISQNTDNSNLGKQCNQEIEELKRRIKHLSIDYVRLSALKEENAVLRKTLGFKEQQGYETVMTNIISRSVAPNRGFITLDRGSDDGLEPGMAIIADNGIYIGKIYKIHERTAVAILLTDPESKVAISKPGEHRLIGLVEGSGNGAARATLIPQNEEVEVGDIFVTSGTEAKIPSDLIVGLVNQIFDTKTDPFKEATLEPVVKTDYLSIVAVLIPKVLNPNN